MQISKLIFDADGVVLNKPARFSDRFSQDFKMPLEKISIFFQNNYPNCALGKADLKEELGKYIKDWGWQGSAQDLLEYWLRAERHKNLQLLETAALLQDKNINSFVASDSEKYNLALMKEKLSLGDFFTEIFSSCELGVFKSSPLFWEKVYNKLDQPEKSSVLVWDDEQENVLAAAEFGFQAEFFRDFETYKDLMKIKYKLL